MTLHINITDADAERVAVMLAEKTGVSVDKVISDLLKRHIASVSPQSERSLTERIAEIQNHAASLPVLDPRTPEEIIGYDALGILPHGH